MKKTTQEAFIATETNLPPFLLIREREIIMHTKIIMFNFFFQIKKLQKGQESNNSQKCISISLSPKWRTFV